MYANIEIDIEDENVFICLKNCTGANYHITGKWPGVIDEICECLRDYMEGLDDGYDQ